MEHTNHIGGISYLSIQVYSAVGGHSYSSVACHDLDCVTFLHVSTPHIIFSLASYSVNKQSLPLSGISSAIIYLCPDAHTLVRTWQANGSAVAAAVHNLQAALKVQKQKDQAI